MCFPSIICVPSSLTLELTSLTKFKAIRKELGLEHTRQQGHTIGSIRGAMIQLREMYPNAGVREIISLLFHEMEMSVSR